MQLPWLIYLIGINIATFIIWGRDKRKATQKKWRISESMLLGLVAAGGGIGALLGQHLFRHKTIKGTFLRRFYFLIGCWIVAGLLRWRSVSW